MKAIAEYFRDLAADDRYFGAEPPTPDAEMLARIAEREVERRVQVRTDQGAIVLSADTPDLPVAETPVEVEEAVEEAPVEDIVEEVAEDVAEEVPVAKEEPEDVSESILAALQEDAAQDAPEMEETADEDETAPEIDLDAALAETDDAPQAETVEPEDEQPVADAAEITEDDKTDDSTEAEIEVSELVAEADEAPEAAEVDTLEELDEPEIVPVAEIISPSVDAEIEVADAAGDQAEAPSEDDSIAAKLRRIRAVVSKSRELPDEEDFSEDEHADDLSEPRMPASSSVLELDERMAAAAAADDAARDLTADKGDDDFVPEAAEESIDADDLDEPQEEPVRPVRARVIRMKKADFEAAMDAGVIEAEAEAVDANDAEQAESHDAVATEGGLSPDEEAELLAELAQVEAELNGIADDEAPVEPIAADDFEGDYVEETDAANAERLAEIPGGADEDMPRLMEAAQSHMDEPDGSRRRQAIAHLRAAVAATKAEQKAGTPVSETSPEDAYRDDLASVVRPSRVDKTAKTQKSPPPLKLVAEQRIDEAPTSDETVDEPAESPAVAVRPRRVAAADRAPRAEQQPQAEAGSFADYAETVGALELPDILEAAASYLTFVEGRERFSRPMILRMAGAMGEDRFSREDKLRGFGQLLRENKIEKLPGGRFTASQEIGFRPEDRAAG